MQEVINLKEDKSLDFFERTTDMAIEMLKKANDRRNYRESKYIRSLMTGSEITEYTKSIAEEIKLRVGTMPYQAFEIGKLLCEVKSLLPHGSFDNWISENLSFSKSSALNYMNIYKNCMGHPEVLEYFNTSILIEICSPRFPEDLRKEIFYNVTGVFDVTKKDLLKLVFEFRRNTIDIDSPEVQNLLKTEKANSLYNRYKSKLTSLKNILKKQLKEVEMLNKRNAFNPLLEEEDNAEEEKYNEIKLMITEFISKTDNMIRAIIPDS